MAVRRPLQRPIQRSKRLTRVNCPLNSPYARDDKHAAGGHLLLPMVLADIANWPWCFSPRILFNPGFPAAPVHQ